MELEAKFKVESHDTVRQRLIETGAHIVSKGLEHNIIYKLPSGSPYLRGCGLRVRTVTFDSASRPDQATLTFKGPVLPGPLKRREEIEVALGDGVACAAIFGRLGYAVLLRFEKRRERWLTGGCFVELDTVPHLGVFVEIEGPGEPAIRSVQERIGLAAASHIQTSYVSMLLAHCKASGLDSTGLKLL